MTARRAPGLYVQLIETHRGGPPPPPPVSFWRPAPPAGAVTFALEDAYTCGLRFNVTAPARLLAVWRYSPPGANTLPTDVGVWNTGTGALLASAPANWSGPPGSGWVRAPFPGPVDLPATATVGVFRAATAGNSWWTYADGFWPQPAITAGPVTLPAGVTGSVYTAGAALSFPSSTPVSPGQTYWVDVEVEAVQ